MIKSWISEFPLFFSPELVIDKILETQIFVVAAVLFGDYEQNNNLLRLQKHPSYRNVPKTEFQLSKN